MEDSWQHWLSHLGDDAITTSAGSSLSFEDIISFKGHFCDDDDDDNNNKHNNIDEGKKEEKKLLKRGVEDNIIIINNNNNEEMELEEIREKRGTKKGRSSSEAMDHIMSERKRRQQMAERFIALSATIPGLKKIDKASVLQEAINYVKQLQERIAELEQETNNNKKSTKSLIIVRKSHNNNTGSSASSSCDQITKHNDDEDVEVVPEVEARELEKELLIRIHCEKRNGIMIKLLALLENNHLSVASSSILPFGNSALNIIIVAQMTEEFSLTVNDLVKTLKKYLLKLMR